MRSRIPTFLCTRVSLCGLVSLRPRTDQTVYQSISLVLCPDDLYTLSQPTEENVLHLLYGGEHTSLGTLCLHPHQDAPG